MINIRHIRPDEIAIAKQLIYEVAHGVFRDTRPLPDSIVFYESKRQLQDIDDLQEYYFNHDGIFLVMTDGEQIIGTGAIGKLDDEICELKRLWFRFEYHGKGLGYRMIQELFAFARKKGYQRIRLETDDDYQSRAFQLYKRLGFYEIPRYTDHQDEVAMELML